jgi:cobalt-zinc-cadmium efflux system outer membrane protein
MKEIQIPAIIHLPDKFLTNSVTMKLFKYKVFNLTINTMGSSTLRPKKTLTASLTIAVISLMAGLVVAAKAETLQTITINELINTVVLNNPDLLASRQSLDAATAGITSAKALPNPRLEIQSGRHNEQNPAALSGRANGIGVTQFIENPTLRNARIEGAFHNRSRSAQVVVMTENELIAETKRRAYEYLLRKEETIAAFDALGLLEQIRERVKVRVETGEAGRYELIKSDAEIINARQREQTARLQVQQAAISLNRLAAGKLPPTWELNAQLSDKLQVPDLELLKQTALIENPEIKQLVAELDRSRAKISEAEASRWPGVEIRVSQLREPEARQNMIGLSVQLPLLDQRTGPRAEAIAERERALVRLEGRKAELLQQIELTWKSVQIARTRIDALSEGAMRDAESTLKVAQAAYRFGERGILEVLDAERVLRSVRSDLLLARYQLQASLIDLDTLAGRHVIKPE